MAQRPFDGYNRRGLVAPDRELTEVGPGTPGGEYLRRFWQPVAFARDVADTPLRVRILGHGDDGRWYPLTGGGDAADLACTETRVYRLAPTAPPLSGLQVDFQADSLAGSVLVNEIWVETDGHGAT